MALCLPSRNELQSLVQLLPEIVDVSEKWDSVNLHVVVFDDGSNDGTSSYLDKYLSPGFMFSILRSPVPRGKTPALAAAFRYALDAGAQYVFMMDADGQDDPRYLPEMLQTLMSGIEVVNGRRINRRERFPKRQSSQLFNGLIRAITGLSLLDVNSGLKGFSREAAEYLCSFLYGELHRVLLVVVFWAGFRVGEVRVVNRKRTAGASHYGLARGWRGIFDLITLKSLQSYQSRPGHLFAGLGSFFLICALFILVGGFLLPAGAGGFLAGWVGTVALAAGFGSVLLGLGFVSELILFLSRGATSRVQIVVRPDIES